LTAKRDGKALTLMVLDLDGFKEINDALGHHAGDRILQQVAARLRRTLRESDTVARLGGDEFAVLLPMTGLDGGERAARKILQDLDQPFLLDRRALVVRASIGVAGFPVHAATTHELLQRADAAMYAAKSNHSGYALAVGGADRRTAQRLALSSALRKAIVDRQFELEYQPIVDLRTGEVNALEALLRWDHPEQGRLWPEDFIRIAEQTGIIMQLTEFSIDRALADWSRRPGQPSLAISANLSPQTLHSPSLPDRIRHVLKTYGAEPSALVLEITENVIMSDPERSTQCLTDLHDMGVRLAVDDFGTGYSSLSYLRHLPVDELKIDRSFVIGMAGGEDDALVRGIIDLAHSLRLRVVAEGVETAQVCDRLRALGCDAAQGYYIHRPAAVDKVASWVAARV
jgi:diguanylate cyclase (GGDEF)-like protein